MPIYKVQGEKKDGLQKYRVRVAVTDSYGKTRQIERTAYGLEDARRKEYEITLSVKENANPRKMTLQKLYEEYILAKRSEVNKKAASKIMLAAVFVFTYSAGQMKSPRRHCL